MAQQSTFNRTDFYKELYYKELERKSYLTNEVTLLSTTLVALITGSFYLITTFKNAEAFLTVGFQIIGLICLVVIFTAAYFAFKSYFDFTNRGRKNKYLPEIKDIEKYYADCLAQGQAREFDDFINETLVEITDHHIANNVNKTTLLTKAAIWLSRSFACCGVLVFLFLINNLTDSINSSQQKQSNHEPKQQPIKQSTVPRSLTTANAPASLTAAKTSPQGDYRKGRQQPAAPQDTQRRR